MSKRRCSAFHEDTIERLLDRVSYMREELIAIERSLERMQIAKLTRRKGTGNNARLKEQWRVV